MMRINDISKKLKINNSPENEKLLRSIITALRNNKDNELVDYIINADINKIEYLYNILRELNEFFDYSYNTKVDLVSLLESIINKRQINMHAVFCPGYTKTGYKNYIGENNTSRMKQLAFLEGKLEEMDINTKINVTLANIFLENTNDNLNPKWQEELKIHEDKFRETASKYFSEDSISKLSDIYPEEEYIKGFIEEDECRGKTYDKFYKNNKVFYKKMGWNEEEIVKRNKKLFTIYNLLSNYLNKDKSNIYLPMETMYTRSKVMTDNNLPVMYLKKK